MEKARGGFARALRAAFPVTVPVLTGFLCLGVAYGILMSTSGLGIVWTGLMSAVAFGGSMQFVAISLLCGAFDPLQALLLSLMVNARHMFYGLSMLDRYKGMGKARFPLIYMLCDETFSIVSTVEPPPEVEARLPEDLDRGQLLSVLWRTGALRPGQVSVRLGETENKGAVPEIRAFCP